MKKFAFMCLAAFFAQGLAACASNTQQYYNPGNYQTQSWSQKPFEQAKAECRAESLKHHWMGDTYELETPLYKACMEKNGHTFAASAQ